MSKSEKERELTDEELKDAAGGLKTAQSEEPEPKRAGGPHAAPGDKPKL